MALKREYYPSDTIKILNESEGRAGVSGKAAHAISRHLRNSATGGRHTGVSKETFANRFADDPFDEHGNQRQNSGWLGKGDMSILLCELLNSAYGQHALGGLDQGAQRASVQYYFKHGKDFHGNAFDGASAEFRIAATAPTIVRHNDHPNNPLRGQIRSITINKPKVTGVVRMKDVLGAVAVLDNLGGTLHLQTFFPLFEATSPASAEYQQGVVKVTWQDVGGEPFRIISLLQTA